MAARLKIRNIILTGRLPFKRKLKYNEVRRLIEKGTMHWNVINEETSPIIQARILKDGITSRNTRKTACVSIWHSGSINIVGVTSKKEADEYYEKTIKELKKLASGVLE